jgi:hypothetical protein
MIEQPKKTTREQYREGYRQARLLACAIIRSETERQGWERIYRSALALQGVDSWIAWQTRQCLIARDSRVNTPGLYFRSVRDGILPRPVSVR